MNAVLPILLLSFGGGTAVATAADESYAGSFRILSPTGQPPAAFSEFQEFVIDSVTPSGFTGHLLLRNGRCLTYANTTLLPRSGRLQFTTYRSTDGSSYSFEGDLLTIPPDPSGTTPTLEGTLRWHQRGASRAVGKFRFTFHPANRRGN